MFSVPVALFGAFTALVLFRENLGLFSLIGLIMLLGLVAKNPILVIDFTDRLRAQGLHRRGGGWWHDLVYLAQPDPGASRLQHAGRREAGFFRAPEPDGVSSPP